MDQSSEGKRDPLADFERYKEYQPHSVPEHINDSESWVLYTYQFDGWAETARGLLPFPSRNRRFLEYDESGLDWVASALQNRDHPHSAHIVSIVADALRTGLDRSLHEAVLKCLCVANRHVSLLDEYAKGIIPESPLVFEAIVWFHDYTCWPDYAGMPYLEFLQTPYWKNLRTIVLDRDKYQCRNCTATTYLQVHHRTYEHRGYEYKYLDDLTTLCRDCHAKFHDKPAPPQRVHRPESVPDPVPAANGVPVQDEGF